MSPQGLEPGKEDRRRRLSILNWGLTAMGFLSDCSQLLFGCTHKNMSFPITVKNGKSGAAARTYVVCLDCAKEFPYSWAEMRIVESPEGDAGNALDASVPLRNS
jgi:hypothetical protein